MPRDVAEFHDLSVEMREMLEWLEETGEALTPEMEARFDAVDADLDSRIVAFALACDELDRSATAAEAAKNRIAARAVRMRKRIQLLRDYITDHMVQVGKAKVSVPIVTVSILEGRETPY